MTAANGCSGDNEQNEGTSVPHSGNGVKKRGKRKSQKPLMTSRVEVESEPPLSAAWHR